MKLILTMVVSAPALGAPAFAQSGVTETESPSPVTVTESHYIVTVTDNRNHLSCRMPTALPGSRLGPVCVPSAELARYPAYGRPGWSDPAPMNDAVDCCGGRQ